MNVIRILFVGAFLVVSSVIMAQNRASEDAGDIKIEVTDLIGVEQYPSQSDWLKNKISQAVVLNGGASLLSQFMLVPKIFVVSKQAMPGTPPQFVVEMQLHLFLVDAVEKVILQQATFDLKGVAPSEAKAITQALNQFQARNPQLKTFIVKGKEKIIAHYKKNCKKIITLAKSNIKRGNYEEALLLLSSIPEVSSECFEEALALIESIDEEKKQLALDALNERQMDFSWIENE